MLFEPLWCQVHPDKTSCFGAEAAFKLLTQAVSQLSTATSPQNGDNDSDQDQNQSFSNWDDESLDDDLAAPAKKQRVHHDAAKAVTPYYMCILMHSSINIWA